MTDQVREHLAEFDDLWYKCFRYRGVQREHHKEEFRKKWTRKMDRMLTVYNNYDIAVHKAEMRAEHAETKQMALQTELAKLVQENANLKEEITRLRQNGHPQTEMHRPTGGTDGTQAASQPNAGPDPGI